MTNTTQTVTSKGIYHNLPTFSAHDGKKYSAIVTGANGISGAHMVKVLAQSPERWGKIFALSRRMPSSTEAHVKNIAVDFLTSSPEDVAKVLKDEGVEADYIFFTSYVQPPPKEGEGLWSDTEAMEEQNAPLNLSLCPYHLQHYPHPIPPPNRCQKLRHSSRPCAVEDAAINIVYPLTIYASVQKQLGEPLGFPGDFNAWDVTKDLSMAELIAYHAEWAVLTNGAVNQALNISDGSEFSYGKFWPILASWYGIKASFPESDTAKYGLLEMPFEPPPRGFGRRGRINATWTFGEWASRKDVQGAWKLLADKYGLKQDPFESAVKTQSTIGLLDAEILGPWPRAISMDASRKLGWNGFVDTREGIRVVVGKLAELGMVPPLEGGVEA